MTSPNKSKDREWSAIDGKKWALTQAIKHIIPPPYMLQIGDMEEIQRKGWTETTFHMENERRSREYEATIERMYDYVSSLLDKQRVEINMKIAEDIRAILKEPHVTDEWRLEEFGSMAYLLLPPLSKNK